jgi:uncharacterized protein (TIGR03000 family)
MKIKLLALTVASFLGLLATSGSAQAQIGYRRDYLGGLYNPLYAGLYGGGIQGLYGNAFGGYGYGGGFSGLGYGYGGFNGYGYGGFSGYGLNPYSNEGRSFTNPNYGFRYAQPANGATSEGWSPYAGTPGEVSYAPSNDPTGDPLLAAVFAPGSGVSGDIGSSTATLTRQTFVTGPASTTDKLEFHCKVPTATTKLYFNGNLVDQTGEDRWLSTRPLTDGIIYAYYVRATWTTSDGREVSYIKSLHAKPGQLLTIDFTTRATAN